jgi:hypothetical protein
LLYVAGRGVAEAKLPLVRDPLRKTPRFAGKKLSGLRKLVVARGEFATPEQLIDQRHTFERQLIQYLNDRRMIDRAQPQLCYIDPPDDNPLLTI